MHSVNTRRQLALLFIFVFIDLLGFSLILPLLPFYAETFDASPTVVGLLLGANALAQLIGAPIVGRLSDQYGRRPLLIVSIGGTVVSFLLLGWANSLWMLFVSRILDGLLGGNISLAQAYITDVTDEQNRARGLGLIGASFGLGFIIGPIIGGTLSAGGNYSLPAFAAAGLSALSLLGVAIWLPESLTAELRRQRSADRRPKFSIRALLAALRRPCVGPLLHAGLFFGLAFTMFQTVFALFAERRLSLTAQETSYVLAYAGVLIAGVQGGAIGPLSKRFTDRELILAGSVLLSVALLAWALTPTFWALLVVLAPLSLASGILQVSLNSALTKSVYPEEVGGTLGLAASLAGLTRVIAPVLGGFLLGNVSTAAPGVLGALLMTWLASYVWRRIYLTPTLGCPEPRESG
jgi:DHA1 family tetracycline resistance protein-like MFS transporter